MLLLNKTLLKLSKGLWVWIIAIVLVRFASLAAITGFIQVISEYLGTMFSPVSDTAAMMDAIRAALIAAVIMFAAQMLQGELEYRCTAAARKKLRTGIFSKVLELDAGNIEKIGPVSAVTASVDAVENMQVYYSTYLPSLIYSVIAPVWLYFNLRNTSAVSAVILLCVSLILLPLNNVFRGKIEKLRKVYWTSLEDMTAYYLDSLRGLTTLKLFDRDEEHAQVLAEKADTLNININKFMKVNFTSFLVTEGLIYAAIITAVFLSVADLQKGLMTLAQTLTVLMLSYSYFGAIRQLMSATHSALTAVSAAGKVEEILAVDAERPYDPGIPIDPNGYQGIRMRDVSFSYEGRETALRHVSIDAGKGKVTALAGLSGCGKSTCASLMMRFMDPESGTIAIEGKNYISMKPEEVRKQIIMVPQSVYLFSGTIRENLLIADPDASDEEMMQALREVRLADFVMSLPDGLDSDVGDAGARLSGGQRQKMGIARALLSGAEYIIFDESTSSVDPESEQEIWATIAALAETRSLIVISHRLSTIRSADRIYILDKGEVAESGTHEELMNNDGLYSRLVREQMVLEEGVKA